MSVSVVPSTRSRRFRFGLRTGLVLIASVALILGLLDFAFRAPYRAEQRSADALNRLGGTVVMIDDSQGWIPKHVSPDLFSMKVAAIIDLSHSRVTDADLIHLKSFKHFGQLDLSDTEIGNAGLELLRRVVGYRFIDLSRTRITDTSSLFGDTFSDQPSGLKLSGNRVANGTIIATLKVMCPLQQLDLSESDADDLTLKKLPDGLSDLSELDLSGTNVTDKGLAELARFQGLTSLDLSNTRVTPEGAARLTAQWKGRLPLAVTMARGTGRPLIPPYVRVPK